MSINNLQIEILLFSGQGCSICQVIKPKIKAMVNQNFPEISLQVIDIEKKPLLAAEHSVFTLPVLLLRIDKKEYHRFMGSFSLLEVQQNIQRLINQINA